MTCAVVERRRAQAAAERIAAEPSIAATSLTPPAEDPTGSWTIEITTERGQKGIEPHVLALLADFELTLRECAPRHEWWHALAVV